MAVDFRKLEPAYCEWTTNTNLDDSQCTRAELIDEEEGGIRRQCARHRHQPALRSDDDDDDDGADLPLTL